MLAHTQTMKSRTASPEYVQKITNDKGDISNHCGKDRLFSKLCWDKCTEFLFKYGIRKGFLTMTQSPEGKKEKTDKMWVDKNSFV